MLPGFLIFLSRKWVDVTEYDEDAGLYYFNARWYDAKSGRFVARDPVMRHHHYIYVWNSPNNDIDPSGAVPGYCWNIAMLCQGVLPGGPLSFLSNTSAKHCWIKISDPQDVGGHYNVGPKWDTSKLMQPFRSTASIVYKVYTHSDKEMANNIQPDMKMRPVCCREASWEQCLANARKIAEKLDGKTGIWAPFNDCEDVVSRGLRKAGCKVTRSDRKDLGIPRWE